MKKPNETILKLYSFGAIKSIEVDYRQTGTETAESFVRMTNTSSKVIIGKWRTYERYLMLKIFTNSVAELRREYREQAKEWFRFESENKKELEEYERLKKKFG